MSNLLYNRLVSKLKKIQYSQATGNKILSFGAIYLGTYTNYKQDRKPLIWCQWSDKNYTHGINFHYLNRSERDWFTRTIYLMAKGKQRITPKSMYLFLKTRKPSIIKKAYRKYFTSLLNMRLVSAGITNLHNLVYTDHREGFIHALNKQLKPSEMSTGATQIAYTTEELQDRINMSSNSYTLHSQTVQPKPKSPFVKKAPWMK